MRNSRASLYGVHKPSGCAAQCRTASAVLIWCLSTFPRSKRMQNPRLNQLLVVGDSISCCDHGDFRLDPASLVRERLAAPVLQF